MSARIEAARGLDFNEPLIFEQGPAGRVRLPLPGRVPTRTRRRAAPAGPGPPGIPGLPEVSEVDVVRHYTRISQWNFGIDLGFYPLGSCTMKYNPRVNEDVARLPGFARAHPLPARRAGPGGAGADVGAGAVPGGDQRPRPRVAPSLGRGARRVDRRHDDPRLPPVQGAIPRPKILIPESAHGTNPASSALCGYQVVPVKSGPRGVVEPQPVAEAMDDQVAGDHDHQPQHAGALRGAHRRDRRHRPRQGRPGVLRRRQPERHHGSHAARRLGRGRDPDQPAQDLLQPHGGGRPGRRAGGCRKHLAPFLPVPVPREAERRVRPGRGLDRPRAIGKVRSFAATSA